jgi:hypothetical protein
MDMFSEQTILIINIVSRVAGETDDECTLNNYANSAMVVLINGLPVTITDALNGKAGMGKTLAELKTESFYTTQSNWNDNDVWNFDEVWDICESKTLPWLRWQNIDCDNLSIVDNTVEVHIKVYPNPTTGELRIENYESAMGNIQIFDLMGRVQKVESKKTATEITLDISHLSSGVYFLKVETASGAITQKVIKE